MKLLLDTHTAIWLMSKKEMLSFEVKTILLDHANTLHVSIISAWEVAIKASLGKLPEFNGGAKAFLTKVNAMPIVLIPVMPQHVEMVETLPFHHRDPLDWLLIATAMADGMTILTADKNIYKYDVPFEW